MSNEDQVMEREALEALFSTPDEFEWLGDKEFKVQVLMDGMESLLFCHFVWPEAYPEEIPLVRILYDDELIPSDMERKVLEEVEAEANELVGSMMVLSLLEIVKEWAQRIQQNVQETKTASGSLWAQMQTLSTNDASNKDDEETKEEEESEPEDNIHEKAKGMTKGQKRRLWDQVNQSGERERGWNWMNLITHLQQTPMSRQ